jgi:hypothetical protein
MGFEPMTSSLPRKCSTPELRRLIFDLGFGMFNHPVSFFHFKSEIEISKSDIPFFERKTRFELATYSLEGYRSTN